MKRQWKKKVWPSNTKLIGQGTFVCLFFFVDFYLLFFFWPKMSGKEEECHGTRSDVFARSPPIFFVETWSTILDLLNDSLAGQSAHPSCLFATLSPAWRHRHVLRWFPLSSAPDFQAATSWGCLMMSPFSCYFCKIFFLFPLLSYLPLVYHLQLTSATATSRLIGRARPRKKKSSILRECACAYIYTMVEK